MPRRKKSTMLYRPFLREALRLTWKRKSLWIFGIFAALISTGGVADALWRTLNRVEQAGSFLERMISASFIGYDLAASYISQLTILGPQRVSMMVIATTLIGLLLIVMAVLSQGALILGIGSQTTQDPYVLRQEAGKHFWSLFLIGLINKLAIAFLILLMTLPLLLVRLSTTVDHILLYLILMLLFVPLTVIVNIIYMFSLMDTVEKNAHPLDAIHTSLHLLRKQWLSAFEYGLILFLCVLGAGFLFMLMLGLLVIPLSILYVSAVMSGSFFVSLSFMVVTALIFILLILAFGGACVTFQYAAWLQFYRHGLHKTHGKKVFSKIFRLVHIDLTL